MDKVKAVTDDDEWKLVSELRLLRTQRGTASHERDMRTHGHATGEESPLLPGLLEELYDVNKCLYDVTEAHATVHIELE